MNALMADSCWLDPWPGNFSVACAPELSTDKVDTITGSREDAVEGETPALVKAARIDELSSDASGTTRVVVGVAGEETKMSFVLETDILVVSDIEVAVTEIDVPDTDVGELKAVVETKGN